MRSIRLLRYCAGSLVLASLVMSHRQAPVVEPDADWATRHMAEEHHIGNFDAGAFFSLHDFDDNGLWDGWEIQKTYGLEDPSHKDTPPTKRVEVLTEVLKLMDENNDGHISRVEFLEFHKMGGVLPDLGTGPGHHGDAEYEYEIHHWEKYHDENTKEEDLVHPEDIEHFKHHDDEEDELERIAEMDRQSIVEKNIPLKFLRPG